MRWHGDRKNDGPPRPARGRLLARGLEPGGGAPTTKLSTACIAGTGFQAGLSFAPLLLPLCHVASQFTLSHCKKELRDS